MIGGLPALVIAAGSGGAAARGPGTSDSPCSGAELLVDALGFFELVLEGDDPAGGFHGGAGVDEFAGAGGDAQLIAGVAAVAALGAQGVIRRCSPRERRKAGVVPSMSAARPMV